MMESIKKRIIRYNLHLNGNEIKKKLREVDPGIKNEEVEKLILDVLKEEKELKQTKNDMER